MNVFNIDDAPNIFKHSFDSSMFKFNNTNDNDDNIVIASNKYITTWNISLVNGFIIFNVLVNLLIINKLYKTANPDNLTQQLDRVYYLIL